MTSTATAYATRPAKLTDEPASATLPASDLTRARSFYEDILGFQAQAMSDEGITYEAGQGTRFILFPSSGQPSGSHTQMGWLVKDVDAMVADLRSRGVTFETYDMPGVDQATGIRSREGSRGAWFKDTEGNLLSIFQEK